MYVKQYIIKGKFRLPEKAMKDQAGNRGIALLFL